jgi:hypothetical protein
MAALCGGGCGTPKCPSAPILFSLAPLPRPPSRPRPRADPAPRPLPPALRGSKLLSKLASLSLSCCCDWCEWVLCGKLLLDASLSRRGRSCNLHAPWQVSFTLKKSSDLVITSVTCIPSSALQCRLATHSTFAGSSNYSPQRTTISDQPAAVAAGALRPPGAAAGPSGA